MANLLFKTLARIMASFGLLTGSSGQADCTIEDFYAPTGNGFDPEWY